MVKYFILGYIIICSTYHERKNILADTHTNQSIANKRETSLTGASMALRTTSSRTSAALGTEADETEAAVDVRLRETRLQ